MTDIEIPDNEDAACDGDATGWLRREIENHNTSRESAYVSCRLSDLRRVLAHIDRIESELNDALCEAAAQRELATLLELESTDPLTRIAAALERPSREWVAALVIAATCGKDLPGGGKRDWDFTWHDHARNATAAADALLAEMGEG